MTTGVKEHSMIYEQMKAMIALMDRLRDLKLDELISLPRIAVLGTQSAGKSSLLESICGVNFLPRGSGIVTRVPLELRMAYKNVPEPYFVFANEFGGKSFSNPDEVRTNIEKLTDKLAGNEKSISKTPIVLNAFGPEMPTLTVIDLPGITKISVGNQPKDIEQLTKDLVTFYCQDPLTIILCVIPANIDLSTSESLKIAQELDPSSERTLGVLTKIDLMDDGVDASNILLNKDIKLFYGYVGVKGRTQREINEKVKVEQAIRNEVEFFAKHPVYSTLSSELLGTQALVTKTTTILHDLIKTSLPAIKIEIVTQKSKIKQLLENTSGEILETDEQKMELVYDLIQTLHDYVRQEMTGKLFDARRIKKFGTGVPPKANDTLVYQFNRMSNDLLSEYFDNGYRVSAGYSDDYIVNAIVNYQGENLPGFYSFDSFIFLINQKLQLLQGPSVTLLEEIKGLVEEKGSEIIGFFFGKYPLLMSNCKDIFQKVVLKYRYSTRKILEGLVKCNENYFFTNDHELLDLAHASLGKTKMSSKDLMVFEMRSRLDKYFHIIVRNLRDTVPKIIGSFFINRIVENLKIDMLQELRLRDFCISHFKDNSSEMAKLKKLKSELNSLNRAEDLLVSEFGMSLTSIDEPVKPVDQYRTTEPLKDADFEFDRLLSVHDDFLYLSEARLRHNNKAPQRRPPPTGQDEAKGYEEKTPRDSAVSSDHHSVSDSSFQKRYTIDKGDNQYHLKDEWIVVGSGNQPSQSLHNSNSLVANPSKDQTQVSGSFSSGKGNPHAHPQINQQGLSVNEKMRLAKTTYETYETVNKNLTPEEQKAILKTGKEAYKYGQDNLTQDQVKTGVYYAKETGKFISENVTKEQMINGGKAVYSGGKYVAESKVGQAIGSGIKGLLSKETTKPEKPPETKPGKNNLFGDYF
jgi:GTPase SAR1 family protein